MERIPKYLMRTVMAMVLCFSTYGVTALAGDGPDEVVIDSLAQLYEPVYFDHAMHEEIAEGTCSICHHHTLGSPPVNANCLRCHADSGESEQISCQGCHSNKRFDADYINRLI